MPRKRTRTHINSTEKNEKRVQTKGTYERKEQKEQMNEKNKRTEEKNELLTKERSVHTAWLSRSSSTFHSTTTTTTSYTVCLTDMR